MSTIICRMAIMERLFLFGFLVPFVTAVYIKTGWVDYYQSYTDDYKVVCYYDSFAHYRDGKYMMVHHDFYIHLVDDSISYLVMTCCFYQRKEATLSKKQ